MLFTNKTYIVTGGGTGIGRQIALDLESNGAKVYILGRTKKTLKETEDKGKGSITFKVCDISSYSKVQKTLDQIGRIDGLVNNAAINPSRDNILNTNIEDWQKTLDTNLTGVFNCSKVAIRNMLGDGSIVNIGSVAGLMGTKNKTSYIASKSAIVGLTKALAIDFAESSIRVNCVCPGHLSEGLPSEYLKRMPQEEYKKVVEQYPLRRLGTLKDVSNLVLFLLSDQSKWITGAIIPVDGGYTCSKEH